ncbi:hypothetical protein [Sphingomonas sp. CGMCC 1.13658]|uniref:hypothetical protein n=1 Tax=Sphingomonas sp. CGMCC 1.13658 TaxID=2755554 RepID=UPI0012ED8D2E|nr:hypothetical protein [Sphingomonas sp. CGMCC 1.13658]MBA2919707.1 hypothetical protein [Sphingomonas sp. CGMCC 1.13658]
MIAHAVPPFVAPALDIGGDRACANDATARAVSAAQAPQSAEIRDSCGDLLLTKKKQSA